MAISNTPSPLSNIIAAKTYNAAWFSGSTKEAQITAAIAAAATDGALYVYVPANMLPYTASLVTFNTAVRMIREGGDPSVYDVRAYGTTGNGLVDDTSAIQAAMNAASGKRLIFGDSETYLISLEITGVSNLEITGNGATIKATTRIRSYLGFVNKSNIRISGLTFDQGQSVLTTYTLADYNAAVNPGGIYNAALYFNVTTNITIEKCTFSNLYTNAMMFIGDGGIIKIIRNTFTSPVQAQKLKAEHIFYQTGVAHLTIFDNDFDNAAPPSSDFGVPAIFLSGSSDSGRSSVRILNNRFNYCGRNSVGQHQLATVSSYGDVTNMVVNGNMLLNNLQQVIRLSVVKNVEVAGNMMTMATVAGIGDQMISIEGTWTFSPGLVGAESINIHDNIFRDDTDTTRIGILTISYDWSIPTKDVNIHDNLFLNMKYALQNQGPYSNLRFHHNTIRGANGGSVISLHNAAIAAVHGVTEAQSSFKDLYICDNLFDLTTNSGQIFPDFTKAPAYTGTIGEIDISRNTMRSAALSANTAITGRGVAGAPQGIFRCNDNRIELFAALADIANFGELTFAQNKAKACTNFRLNPASNTLEVLRGNRQGTGVTTGRAIMAAGTILVLTNEILTGDNVLFTVVAPAGAQGFLSLGAIVNKTSFVINSTNAGDTSTVFWEIVH